MPALKTNNIFRFWDKTDDILYKRNLNDGRESITGPRFDDGAIEVEATNGAVGQYNGIFSVPYGTDNSPFGSNTKELINTYRGLMSNYEVDNAVQEIVQEAIVYEKDHDVVSLDLDSTEFSDSIKDKIYEEFKLVLNALNFQRKGSDHFRRWYVDSRIYFHKIINTKRPKEGILELRRLDPKAVEYVRELVTEEVDGIKVVKGWRGFFLYDVSDGYECGGRTYTGGTKIRIPESAITYAHSGLTDCCGKKIIGYLHRAVKPANQLKMLEDALVIYRITRAPDRRVFYIDTGMMGSKAASQHMQNIMNSFKNKVVYDASTGKVKNQQNNLSLTEDFWLMRRDGKNVTEVDTLPGMSGMNEIDDVKYFRKALYMALRVPLSRIPDDDTGSQPFDNGTTISRDEINFSKFIRELQHKFSDIILDPLKTNLLLKKIITEDEWNEELNNIAVDFHQDSYFTEIRDLEIEDRRISLLERMDPYIGKYRSHNWAMKSILRMSEDDIKAERKQIDIELKDPLFKEPEEEEL